MTTPLPSSTPSGAGDTANTATVGASPAQPLKVGAVSVHDFAGPYRSHGPVVVYRGSKGPRYIKTCDTAERAHRIACILNALRHPKEYA